jgi:hypothetical protein
VAEHFPLAVGSTFEAMPEESKIATAPFFILSIEGGVFASLDMRPLQLLDDIVDTTSDGFLTFSQDSHPVTISPCIMGMSESAPILAEILDKVKNKTPTYIYRSQVSRRLTHLFSPPTPPPPHHLFFAPPRQIVMSVDLDELTEHSMELMLTLVYDRSPSYMFDNVHIYPSDVFLPIGSEKEFAFTERVITSSPTEVLFEEYYDYMNSVFHFRRHLSVNAICTDGTVLNSTTCSNGLLDDCEADVDCGQACTSTCALNSTCFVDEDCTSGFCDTDETSTCLSSNTGSWVFLTIFVSIATCSTVGSIVTWLFFWDMSRQVNNCILHARRRRLFLSDTHSTAAASIISHLTSHKKRFFRSGDPA